MTDETLQESNDNKDTGTDKGQAETQGNGVNNLELIREFNDILGTHIERLLDTRYGIEGLELNIFSISCIVLLATRETEIETFPAQPPSRYTVSSLTEELAEMSIEPDSEIDKVIEDMTGKSYLKINDERLFSDKSMGSMAQLFDRIFPKMPGLNLVAYLGQMIDEVLAGRKAQVEASRQFNQMLELQGVSINEAAAPKPAKKKFSHLRLGDDSPPPQKVRRPVVMPGKPANIFSQLKTGNVIKTTATVRQDISPPPEEVIAGAPDASAESRIETNNMPAETPEPQKTVHAAAAEPEVIEEVKDTGVPETTEEQESVSDNFEPVDDREIEDRILEFEGQLGLKCPFCGNGSIKTSETAKGKAYYHCSSSECNFISWGKPYYYFDCPKCDSNFLIEITDSSGKSFLKCPKATCTHWQKFPWDISDQGTKAPGNETDSGAVISKPKRKVRRRVVRRKKSS